MPILFELNAQLLKDNKGNFTADDGRNVDYHNAKFFDLGSNSLFKANVPADAVLPPVAVPSPMTFSVILGEQGCKVEFVGLAPKTGKASKADTDAI